MRLSAIPEAVSTFRLRRDRVYLSYNSSVYLNSYDDERTYIMPASDWIKKEHPDGWGDLLKPIVAKLDHRDCSLNLTYKANKYLQRYGFYVQLTPEPTGGQIQWPKAWAVEPPQVTNSFSTAALRPSCEEAYYKEPCPAS